MLISVKLHLDPDADKLLSQMADEAGMSKADLAEIAVFNLIALWMKGRAFYTIPVSAHDGADISG